MTITSQHNHKLKEIRKLRMRKRARERAGRFVAEGEDLLASADAGGWVALERFCATGSGLPGVEVDSRVLTQASGLASGTRTLAVYEECWAAQPLGPLCIYLQGVHDPGNVGAVLRSAQAFGASSVAFGPASADPFSPKAVRASMGAVFSVPVARVRDLGTAAGDSGDGGAGDPGALTGAPHRGGLPGLRIALVPGAGPPLAELWRSGSAYMTQNAIVPPAEATLMIGSEREGLPPEVVEHADQIAHIPIRTDSLNAAMAATVALYELTRMARG